MKNKHETHWRLVTYCDECKFYVQMGKTKQYGCTKNSFMGIPMPKKPDHYCAEAERKRG